MNGEIEKFMQTLTLDWELVGDKMIRRTFAFPDFKEAIEFVNKVADVAENANHHPDISIAWNKVTIELSTHSIGGLSEKDFAVASKIEKI